ncbi:hypothetical protein HDIA_1035 [Hartmannibacter diazotrophicus]|uniref:Uncharacterized protein n=1 Tax=Hartmannibacter diazotrophicus TaxID=1482074 RepID=A0A2C9D2T3_9HYPH|nr:hypothetical protein [Hartmannibacter diazotrophicus]SON54576.1 hypothetical protein HDIA_1035 [Hartmannibacter diazotrophicus]
MASDLIAQLGPLRLPADFAVFGWRDYLAALSIGLLVACLVAALLRPLFASRRDDVARLALELDSFKTLNAGERLYRQAAVLRSLGGDVADVGGEFAVALYGSAPVTDLDALDEKILGHARRRR